MRLTVILFPLVTVLCAGLAGGTFETDDVLVTSFDGANTAQYRNLALENEFDLASTEFWVSAAAHAGGDLVAVYRGPSSNAAVVSAAGNLINSFAVSSFVPTDVDLLLDGTLAVAIQNTDRIELYSLAGLNIGFFQSTGGDGTFGIDVAPDGTLWAVNRNSTDVDHFAADGTELGTFALSFEPGDVAADPLDGSLWITQRDGNTLRHFTSTGALINSFSTSVTGNFDGLALTSDGTILVSGSGAAIVYRYASDGATLGTFSLDAGSPPFRLNVVPEPSAAVGAVGALLTVLGLRRSRNG